MRPSSCYSLGRGGGQAIVLSVYQKYNVYSFESCLRAPVGLKALLSATKGCQMLNTADGTDEVEAEWLLLNADRRWRTGCGERLSSAARPAAFVGS